MPIKKQKKSVLWGLLNKDTGEIVSARSSRAKARDERIELMISSDIVTSVVRVEVKMK